MNNMNNINNMMGMNNMNNINNMVGMNNMTDINDINNINNIDDMNNLIMNLINQNIQMANQIAINNNILKKIMEKRSSMNISNNNIKEKINNLESIDFFPGNSTEKTNVLFESSTSGFCLNMVVPKNVKMEELLLAFIKYLEILGIKENLNNLIFLFDAHTIELDEQKTIFEYGLIRETNKIIWCKKDVIIGG